ncbi:MAG: DNA-deoxyinosine glycosylase [Clostridiales bacterium]|nr:DNA-deoxyinosine glycosylase [Clostridiales bacterium]
MDGELVCHPFEPVWSPSSQVLILGTMPSLKSRLNQFYYGHPQNRFWPLLARLFACPVPQTSDARRALILDHQLALWDVLMRCTIRGSADSAIRSPIVNPIADLVARCPIRLVVANGQKAGALYRQHVQAQIRLPLVVLPSTSPANARLSLDDLAETWQVIPDCLSS